ncbi:MAG: response regulator transcription factor [Christensenellaceae bacterium]|nr:response regulator transcription factor [Christensenellaceae bacterium]
MAQGKTILVVDDEFKIVDVLKSYLEKAGYVVVCAGSGSEAIKMFDKHSPALVVLDLMLPDMAGEDVCRAIRQKSRAPIIMLTAKIEEESILKGLEIGADDYVTKPFSPRQIVARVNAVLRRASAEVLPVADELSFNGGELVIDNLRHEVRKNGKKVPLTPNEFKILFTLAKYPTKAFTRDEIITMALGYGFEGYDRVIDTHIKNLRQKIENDPKSPEYILTVHGVGYKFGGTEREDEPEG